MPGNALKLAYSHASAVDTHELPKQAPATSSPPTP